MLKEIIGPQTNESLISLKLTLNIKFSSIKASNPNLTAEKCQGNENYSWKSMNTQLYSEIICNHVQRSETQLKTFLDSTRFF